MINQMLITDTVTTRLNVVIFFFDVGDFWAAGEMKV